MGDQLSVIPSFVGDGMAMALASGLAAADAIAAGQASAEFHAAWARRTGRQMRVARGGAWLMRAMPGLFIVAAGSPAATLAMRATRMR